MITITHESDLGRELHDTILVLIKESNESNDDNDKEKK